MREPGEGAAGAEESPKKSKNEEETTTAAGVHELREGVSTRGLQHDASRSSLSSSPTAQLLPPPPAYDEEVGGAPSRRSVMAGGNHDKRRSSSSSVASGIVHRQSLQDLLQIQPFQPRHRAQQKVEWLKRRNRLLFKLVPGQVKEVHHREQQCAFFFWATLVTVFLAYSSYLAVQMFEQRASPPQAVSFNDPELVHRLNVFPNLIACFPYFGGDRVDWLPAATVKHAWVGKNQSEDYHSDTILTPDSCGLVRRTWNRNCLFYDGANLAPNGTVGERGLEIYLSFIRNSPMGKPDELIYRGAMLTMTEKSREEFCEVVDQEKAGIAWQEMPFDEPKFENAAFLSYYEIELQLRMVTRLKKDWDPVNSQEPAYSEYTFTPRLASFHMGSDATMLGPDTTQKLKAVKLQFETGDYSQIPAIARFIITQREEVLSFTQLEPFQPFTLFGTLAGAWGGILGIFTIFFASTASGRRRLPGFIRAIICRPSLRYSKQRSFGAGRGGSIALSPPAASDVPSKVDDSSSRDKEAEAKDVGGDEEPPDLAATRSLPCLPRPHSRHNSSSDINNNNQHMTNCLGSWSSFTTRAGSRRGGGGATSSGSSSGDTKGDAGGDDDSDSEDEGPDMDERMTRVEKALYAVLSEPVLPSATDHSFLEVEGVDHLREEVNRMHEVIEELNASMSKMQQALEAAKASNNK